MRRTGMWRASPGRGAIGIAMVVVATLVAACAPSPGPAGPPAPLEPWPAAVGLRVMTYNVLGLQMDDRGVDEHAGFAARVRQIRPDILVLQEAQSDDVRAVHSLTGGEYRAAVFREWHCDVKPEREGVAILVRSSIGVLDTGATHIGDGACLDPWIMRVLVWTDLDLPGGTLRVYGTHLSQPGTSHDASRTVQIRELRGLIDSHDPDDERRWVLAGDMNVVPGDGSHRLLVEGDGAPGDLVLSDTFAELHPSAADPDRCPVVREDDTVGMAFLLDHPEHVRSCGFTAGWPRDDNLACWFLSICDSPELRRDTSVRIRLDYVLVDAAGPIRATAGFVPHRDDPDWASPGAEWFTLSDHLPYVADLDIDRV